MPVPAELRPIATRALAPDPRQRFPTADEMLEALRAAGRPAAHESAPQDAPQPVVDATAVLPAPEATSILRARPAAAPRATRRRWSPYVLPAVAIAIVATLLILFLVESGQPANQPASRVSRSTVVKHHAAAPSDPERTAITQLARSLAGGGLPGDGALASALDATAAESPGAGREAAAEATLTLAGVLVAGGGITSGQFQDVATVLAPTGATVPTTTVPTTTPPPAGPAGHGHGPGADKSQGG
jgi:serine/threonine-protein kinase